MPALITVVNLYIHPYYNTPEIDNSAENEDLERQADYWEDQYCALPRDDPQCLNYKTKDAQYNMNYFRRKANELG